MRIIESKTESKAPERLCEDLLVTTQDFIAVIDGVTPKSDFSYKGKSTGRLAAECVAQAVKEAEKTDDCSCIIRRCNEKFRDFYRSVEFPYDKKEKGLQAAAIIYSDHFREIWMIGDCQAMVDGTEYQQPKKSDVILSQFRSLMMALDTEAADARARIEPWILKATAFANKRGSAYGYSVLNGEEIPEERIKVIRLSEFSGSEHEIILASDGYPVLKPTLQQSERELEYIMREDPQCCRLYESTKGLKSGNKSFDDRTYIRFQIEA